MTILYFIGIAIALGAAIWWLVRYYPFWDERKDVWRALDQLGIPKHKAKLKYRYTTPKDVFVWSTVEVPPRQLKLIDEGIAMQIEAVGRHRPEWKLFRRHEDYAVLVIDPMATNRVNDPGSPALIVSQMGQPQTQTAGTTIGTKWKPITYADGSYKLTGTTLDRPYIVLPHQEETQWRYTDYFRNSTRNESEHVVEYINNYDGDYLAHTGANDVHPHFV